MPRKQSEQVAWSANFSQKISQPGFNVGLSEAQITAFGTVNGTLQAAWQEAIDPSTRTKGKISAKDVALKNMKAMAKNLVSIIQGTSTVTDEQKDDLLITIRKTTPSPIPAPTTSPKIDVLSVTGHEFKLRLSDVDRPTSKAKPAGTIGVNLYSFVGETPPTNVQDWKSEGTATKPSEVTVTIDESVAPATTVWFTAFWFNARGSGPATEPVSAVVQLGGLSKGNILSAEPKVRKAA